MNTWQSQLAPLEQQYGIPPGLLGALVRAESGGNPNAVSPAGAIGLGQLMPGTARALGVNPHDPLDNLRGAAMYLSQNLKAFGNDPSKALAAYNAGPGHVREYNGIPPFRETQDYVKRVTGYWKESSRYGQSGVQLGQGPATVAVKPYAALPMPVRKTVPGTDQASLAKLQYLYEDEPTMGSAIVNNRLNAQQKLDDSYAQQVNKIQLRNDAAKSHYNTMQYQNGVAQQANQFQQGVAGSLTGGSAAAGGKGFFRTPNGFVRNRMPGELGYQFLQRLGTKGFGLQNDPGNTQTYGGGHRVNSLHYDKRAVDFGNARNSEQLLQEWYNYVNSRRNIIGVKELLDEGDHIHVGVAS